MRITLQALFFDVFQDVNSAYAGQEEVGDDDIVALSGEQVDGFFSGSNGFYLIAFTFKEQGEPFTAARFIIYEEHASGIAHTLHPPLAASWN